MTLNNLLIYVHYIIIISFLSCLMLLSVLTETLKIYILGIIVTFMVYNIYIFFKNRVKSMINLIYNLTLLLQVFGASVFLLCFFVFNFISAFSIFNNDWDILWSFLWISLACIGLGFMFLYRHRNTIFKKTTSFMSICINTNIFNLFLTVIIGIDTILFDTYSEGIAYTNIFMYILYIIISLFFTISNRV